MSAGTDTSRENLTLTDTELAACHPIAGEDGHVLRALCPYHGSDHQRSLRVTVATGRFVCFACGAWGYLAEARERWREEQQRQAASRRPPARQQRVPRQSQPPPTRARQPVPREPASARPDLVQQLAAFQAALPGSHGEAYLQRGAALRSIGETSLGIRRQAHARRGQTETWRSSAMIRWAREAHMQWDEAGIILHQIQAATRDHRVLRELAQELLVAAVRYARLRRDWALQEPAQRQDIDLARILAHTRFIDACNILSRMMRQQGYDISWRARIGRSAGKLATLLATCTVCWDSRRVNAMVGT